MINVQGGSRGPKPVHDDDDDDVAQLAAGRPGTGMEVTTSLRLM